MHKNTHTSTLQTHTSAAIEVRARLKGDGRGGDTRREGNRNSTHITIYTQGGSLFFSTKKDPPGGGINEMMLG